MRDNRRLCRVFLGGFIYVPPGSPAALRRAIPRKASWNAYLQTTVVALSFERKRSLEQYSGLKITSQRVSFVGLAVIVFASRIVAFGQLRQSWSHRFCCVRLCQSNDWACNLAQLVSACISCHAIKKFQAHLGEEACPVRFSSFYMRNWPTHVQSFKFKKCSF